MIPENPNALFRGAFDPRTRKHLLPPREHFTLQGEIRARRHWCPAIRASTAKTPLFFGALLFRPMLSTWSWDS